MIYETYESAKAAHPECDAVLTAGPNWTGVLAVVGKFIPTYLTKGAGEYRICGDSFPGVIGRELGYVVAEPPTQAKQKTKVEYKLVDATANEIAKRMIDGEVFYSGCGSVSYKWNGLRFTNSNDEPISFIGPFYQKVEITIWRDEARDFITASDTLTPNCWLRKLIDADSQFEPKVSEEFIELCKLIAKRNGGCE